MKYKFYPSIFAYIYLMSNVLSKMDKNQTHPLPIKSSTLNVLCHTLIYKSVQSSKYLIVSIP